MEQVDQAIAKSVEQENFRRSLDASSKVQQYTAELASAIHNCASRLDKVEADIVALRTETVAPQLEVLVSQLTEIAPKVIEHEQQLMNVQRCLEGGEHGEPTSYASLAKLDATATDVLALRADSLAPRLETLVEQLSDITPKVIEHEQRLQRLDDPACHAGLEGAHQNTDSLAPNLERLVLQLTDVTPKIIEHDERLDHIQKQVEAHVGVERRCTDLEDKMGEFAEATFRVVKHDLEGRCADLESKMEEFAEIGVNLSEKLCKLEQAFVER